VAEGALDVVGQLLVLGLDLPLQVRQRLLDLLDPVLLLA